MSRPREASAPSSSPEVTQRHVVVLGRLGRSRFHDDPGEPDGHAPQREHRDTTDPAVLRAILKVREGEGRGYWWVECGVCDHGWQVSHYAAQIAG